MATSTTINLGVGLTATRIDSSDAVPLVSGTPGQRRQSNSPNCQCAVLPGVPDPDPTTAVNAVAQANASRRFPTGTLTSGVYQSGVNI